MDNAALARSFATLSTPLLFDACVRAGVAPRCCPAGLRPLLPDTRLAGAVLPAQHFGSVDVFLEALESAHAGDVLVIDNGGRLDEGCIGDLTFLETRAAGAAGIVVWGVHRDSAELRALGAAVFSLGACPAGPVRLDPRNGDALRRARVGAFEVTRADLVFADDDGVLFVPAAQAPALLETAARIAAVERRQAERIGAGDGLRSQLQFADYLRRRAENPEYSFRQHLRRIGGAIEE